jgi:hypothetical protein
MHDEKHDELMVSTRSETALDVVAAVASLAPWLGGPVSQVLSGMSLARKMERVKEMLDGLAADLQDFRTDVSENYVRTDEFHELLERTLRSAADERNGEKRRIYREFLGGAIRTPGEPYEEQIRFLRTLENVQSDHVRILKAVMQDPERVTGLAGSPLQTLCNRLPDMPRHRIQDLVAQLNDMRLTNLLSLTTMMTAHGAADLRHGLTAYGRRFVAYL